ncbi:MAG: hypothetical protein GF401_08340 [Chitinivibrionales bacterium]|nr:hypothetical protein [Chitinivibrionales bacterium]
MSRQWRIEYEGALHHVLSRGNGRHEIFLDDEDRNEFIDLMKETSERFDLDFYTYVLMGNHYHFLMKTRRANLSKSMQWFGATYTRRFNLRHKRSGHLFQGRFKNFIVENDEYLLRLSCYIHRNPIRAGIVKRLADYEWSSYPAYAHGEGNHEWLDTGPILSQFGGPISVRRKKYREKVQRYSGEEEDLWKDFNHGLFLGSAGFADEIRSKHLPEEWHKEKPQQRELKKSIDLEMILQKAGRIVGRNFDNMKRPGRLYGEDKINRDFLIFMLWETGMYTNEEIAVNFGLSYSSVSKAVSALRKRFMEDEPLRGRFEEIRDQFKNDPLDSMAFNQQSRRLG